MLSNPDYNNIYIYNYYRVILQMFMLALCVFVTGSLTLLYMEVIANIQCYIFKSKSAILPNNKSQVILKKTILKYLVHLKNLSLFNI